MDPWENGRPRPSFTLAQFLFWFVLVPLIVIAAVVAIISVGSRDEPPSPTITPPDPVSGRDVTS